MVDNKYCNNSNDDSNTQSNQPIQFRIHPFSPFTILSKNHFPKLISYPRMPTAVLFARTFTGIRSTGAFCALLPLTTSCTDPLYKRIFVRHQNLVGSVQVFLAQLIASQFLQANLMRLDARRFDLVELLCRSKKSGTN